MSLLSSMEEACMGGKSVAPDGSRLPTFPKVQPPKPSAIRRALNRILGAA